MQAYIPCVVPEPTLTLACQTREVLAVVPATCCITNREEMCITLTSLGCRDFSVRLLPSRQILCLTWAACLASTAKEHPQVNLVREALLHILQVQKQTQPCVL